MHTAVKAALANHICEDDKEAQDCAYVLRCLDEGISCFGQLNHKAHLTGSAFILDPSHRVLFTFHAKLKRWLQLGGHSELDEQCLSETALREAKEESGLTDLVFHPAQTPLLLDVDVHVIPERKSKTKHYHLDFRYVFLTCTPTRIVVSSESQTLEWFSIDEAMGLDIDPALSRALGKLKRLL